MLRCAASRSSLSRASTPACRPATNPQACSPPTSCLRRCARGGGKRRNRRVGKAKACPPFLSQLRRNGGHASAFALRATADKSLCPPYKTNQGRRRPENTGASCAGPPLNPKTPPHFQYHPPHPPPKPPSP